MVHLSIVPEGVIVPLPLRPVGLEEEEHVAEEVQPDAHIVGGVGAQPRHAHAQEGLAAAWISLGQGGDLVVEDDEAVHNDLQRIVLARGPETGKVAASANVLIKMWLLNDEFFSSKHMTKNKTKMVK